jgi:hypothetical protein
MLRPLVYTNEEIAEIQNEQVKVKYPNKTYRIDLGTGEIFAEFIDLSEAIRQTVVKTVGTQRDKYIIYSSNYGSEITSLMGKGYSNDLLELEVPRLIRECLMIYDWFKDVNNFTINKINDQLNVAFNVVTNIGIDDVTVEVSV